MGWDIESPTTIPSNLHLSNLELDSGEVWAYKFHTSWDWLIPVVQKLIDEYLSMDEQDSYELQQCILYDKIDSVYKIVVEIIEKYNSDRG